MFMIFVLVSFIDVSNGNGLLKDPPMRSTLWRMGYDAPINYNDHTLNCGGFYRQHESNDGKCGVCGDPWDGQRENEAGGKFAKEIIVTRHYTSGSDVTMVVEMLAPRGGYFELRLCSVADSTLPVTQECLNQHPLEIVNGVGRRYPVEGEKEEHHGKYELIVRLPAEVTCTHCVIQWKYHAGNEWGHNSDGRMCRGCGPQFEMYNCADVAIWPGDGQLGVGTATLVGGDTTKSASGDSGPGLENPVPTETVPSGNRNDERVEGSGGQGGPPSSIYPHPTETGIVAPSGPHGPPDNGPQGLSNNGPHGGSTTGISDPQDPTKVLIFPRFEVTPNDNSDQTNYVSPTSEAGPSGAQPAVPTVPSHGTDMDRGILKSGNLFNDANVKFDQTVNDHGGHGNGISVSSPADENSGFNNPSPTFLPDGTNIQATPKPDESLDPIPDQIFDDLTPTKTPSVQTTHDNLPAEGSVVNNLKSELPTPSEKLDVNNEHMTDPAIVNETPVESTSPQDDLNHTGTPQQGSEGTVGNTDNGGIEPLIPTLGAKPFSHVNDEHHVSSIENNADSVGSSSVGDKGSSNSASSNSVEGPAKGSVKSSTKSSVSGGWGLGTGWTMGDLSQLQIAPMLLLANKIWGGHGVMSMGPSLGGWGGMKKQKWGGSLWGGNTGAWPGSIWGKTHGLFGAGGSPWGGAGNAWGGANTFTGNTMGNSWTGAGITWPQNHNSWLSGSSNNQWGNKLNSWNSQPSVSWQAGQRRPLAAHLPLCEANQRLLCEGLGALANNQGAKQYCNRNCPTGAECPSNVCTCQCAYQYSLQCRYMTSGIALQSNHDWCNNVCNSGNCPVRYCDCKTLSNW
ncbi:nuclear pore complex protein Nup98-Nup96-like [Haliotis rufescens]|uniref:nuclear pore complex protein Nup98-Nup96-like n=1 Tax=Haliotis rufescens TaxID=6454 RepID=UPI00201F6B2F|nr:nuclear pore complex protein Nup98-Nup96-like [Haliotis rufescens]